MEIIFTPTYLIPAGFEPVPARDMVPEWYRNLDGYMNEGKKPHKNGGIPTTIKKCIPVFDALTTGYILKTYSDVYFRYDEGYPHYTWKDSTQIEFHNNSQAPTYPDRMGDAPYPKWINPWSIRTPKGYSCLFITPVHRELPFKILEGIVDTDKYFNNVNFPFVLKNQKWEGMVPAGTPIAQVIPFKRESFKMKLGGPEDLKKAQNIAASIRTAFFDRYRNTYWSRKEYK